MAIFSGGCPPATPEPQYWRVTVDFRNRLEINSKKIYLGKEPISRKTRIFSCKSRLEINSKKIYLGEKPSSCKTHVFSCKSRDAPRLSWFKPVTSPLLKASSTTTPHTHMCQYAVLILLILYYTECKSVFWGTKQIQIKNLSTTKFHNFLRSTTFMLVVFPFEVNYEIWISIFISLTIWFQIKNL
jgi:hypothetical protein